MAKIKRKVEDKRNEMEEMEKVVLTLYKAEVNLKKKWGNGSVLIEANGREVKGNRTKR